MAALTITVKGDRELTEKLDCIRRTGRVGDAALVWAQAVAKEDRERARGQGGRQFWADQARRITAARHGTGGAAVWMGREAIHRHTGGDIFPDTAKALTIPVSHEARGKRAREFERGGRPLFTLDIQGDPETLGLLGYAEPDGAFHPLYVLRSRVHQDPDPWMAEEDDIRAIGRREMGRFLREMTEA